MQKPFSPNEAYGPTPDAQRKLAVTTSVATLTLPSTVRLGQSVRIYVEGTDPVAWAISPAPNLTIDNGVPMAGPSVEVFGLPEGTAALDFIGKAGGSNVRVTIGEGV